MKKIKRYYIFVPLLILLTTSCLGLYVYKWEYRKLFLEIYFFSLERGRAIFIRTPQNKTILIGGGQNSEVIRGITKVLPFYSRKIDLVIAPAATPAQIGGLIEVIERYEIDEIVFPKIMSTSTVLTQLTREIKKRKIHIVEVEKGNLIEIEKDLVLEILFPYKDFKYNKTSLPELGIVVRFKNTNAYLLGNLSKTIQKDIAKNIEVGKQKNISEYYHSMTDSKLDPNLFEKINSEFIFSTNEKTMLLVSDGEEWTLKK